MHYKEHYLGNPNVKKDGVVQEWTIDEAMELQKCISDPAHYTAKYAKIINLDEGLVPFKMYNYQKRMFEHFKENKFSIVLACRQSGKSISAVAYLLAYAMFNPDKTVVILANKGSTAREMLARITLMLENTPFFLQPGCKTLNKGSIEFSNNSRIIAASTSSDSVRGFSANLVYLDEFAFVNDAATFYTSTYPVIASGKTSKVIITSTANGVGNMYHKLWEGANQGTNEFKPFRVDWWDVPGRDVEWKAKTISNTSQLQFDQEFGNTIFGTGDTLIAPEALLALQKKDPIHRLESNCLNIYEENIKDHEYIMLVDVGKGRGQDYSTFTILDISVVPFRQVAVYRHNKISPILFPTVIHKYAVVYNEAYVIIESNDQGTVVCNGMYHDFEYENLHMSSMTKSDSIGIEINRKNKKLGCAGIKDLIESGKLEIIDEETIKEMSCFEAKGMSYEASSGNHDDLMMNLVLFGYFSISEMFKDMTDIDIRTMMFDKKIKEIEEDVPSFGWFDDGSDHMKSIDMKDYDQEWAIDHSYQQF